MFKNLAVTSLKRCKKLRLPTPLKHEQIPIDENEKASCVFCSNRHSNKIIELYSS